MQSPTDIMKCPTCHAAMQQGFLPVEGGMHFVRGDGRSASSFAEDVPGTHSVLRSNRLLAWRCKGCKLILFRYGRDNAKMLERQLGLAEQVEADISEEQAQEQGLGENEEDVR
jgi:hypothetical protein